MVDGRVLVEGRSWVFGGGGKGGLTVTSPELAVNVPKVGRMYRWLGQELPCPDTDTRGLKRAAAEGLLVPSVTNVKGVRDQSYLRPWAAKKAATAMLDAARKWPDTVHARPAQAIEYAAGAADRYTEEAGRFGDMVHVAIECFLRGEPYPKVTADGDPFPQLTEEALSCLRSFERFVRDYRLEDVEPELTLFGEDNGKRWAGTADGWGRVDGELVVVDWKTNRKGLRDDTVLQLAGLSRCDWAGVPGKAWPVERPTAGLALHLDTEGYQVRRVRDLDASWAVWRALRDVWEWHVFEGRDWVSNQSPFEYVPRPRDDARSERDEVVAPVSA